MTTIQEIKKDKFSQDVVSKLISLLSDQQLLEFDTWVRLKYGEGKYFLDKAKDK